MSISGISSLAPNSSPTGATQADFRQQFNELADALNNGNLEDAQQAYAALSELQDSGQGPPTTSNSPFAKALNQIGQSLQSGDLKGAQQALQSLQQARGSHHHHGHRGGADVSPASQIITSGATLAGGETNFGGSIDITA